MTQMIHATSTAGHSKAYENHQLILDHLDHHPVPMHQDIEDHLQSSTFYQCKKSMSITSTSSPEPSSHYIQPIQQFRVIKDGRQVYEESYRDTIQVTSSEHHHQDYQMGPPPNPPITTITTSKIKIISSSEEPTSSIPDLGKSLKILSNFHPKIKRKKKKNFQTQSIKFPSELPFKSTHNSPFSQLKLPQDFLQTHFAPCRLLYDFHFNFISRQTHTIHHPTLPKQKNNNNNNNVLDVCTISMSLALCFAHTPMHFALDWCWVSYITSCWVINIWY